MHSKSPDIEHRADATTISWNRYRLITFIRSAVLTMAAIILIDLLLLYFVQEIFSFTRWPFWLMIAIMFGVLDAFSNWNLDKRYSIRKTAIEEVGAILSSLDYRLSDHLEDKIVYLKRTGWLRYRVAILYLQPGLPYLEIGERYDELFADVIDE